MLTASKICSSILTLCEHLMGLKAVFFRIVLCVHQNCMLYLEAACAMRTV